MFHHVGQRFLGHAKTLGFDHGIQALLQGVRPDFGLQPGQRGLPLGVPAQRRLQAQIVEHGRAQVQREVMHLFQHALDHLEALFQARRQGVGARRLQQRLQVHFGDGEGLADFVVELAREVPAFGLLHFHQPAGKHLKSFGGIP